MERYLSPQQIEELTGFSKPTVYRLLHSDRLRVTKVNRALRVKESELAKFMDAHTARRGGVSL